ncbi:MAG: ribosomal RNA small subunit methyltransferase A [Deltaproteobacteria bacterium]|nr:ribosomal RNA small subunit methyltransferase A [Candidatus Anaeroferrophillus wilburensis]MBN2889312.1 ribosomal RNA small subunit methyltransferase A [Deltaproteobacteria bacterium]
MSVTSKGGHRHKKKLGQHFLQDGNIVRKIIDLAAILPGMPVLEIGPGNGVLTEALLRAGAAVTAIETDAELIPVLKQRFAGAFPDQFTLVPDDILKCDLPAILDYGNPDFSRFLVVANIPYNITTPIVFSLIDQRHLFSRAVLMVQDEVAVRLLAAPGSKNYGRLSVMVSLAAHIFSGFKVSPACFYPPPQVWSRVITLEFLTSRRCEMVDGQWLGEIVNRLFSQRRKKIVNPLLGCRLTLSRQQLVELLQHNGFSPDCRPETMSVDELCRLARLLAPHR